MPWTGPDPYGTAGGADSDTLPLTPPDIRTFQGRSVSLFLQRNGPLATVARASVEDIIRTLDAGGGSVVRFRIRSLGQIIDDNVFDWEIFNLAVSHVGGGADSMAVPTAAITTDMLQNGSITTTKYADLGVTIPKLDRAYRQTPQHDYPTLFYDQTILDGSVLTVLNVGTFTWATPTNAIVTPADNMKWDAEVQAQVVVIGAAGATIASVTLVLNSVPFTYGFTLTALPATGAQTLKPRQMVNNILPNANVGGIVQLQHLTAADNIQSVRIKIRLRPQLGGLSWP